MPFNQQEKSSPSVKVRYLEASKIIEDLKSISESIINGNRNVSGIFLFGSLSRNNYSGSSDADILILLRADERRLIDRIPEFLKAFMAVPVSVDVFPYTEDEIQKMIKDGNHFISQLWNEKILLASGN